MDFAPIPSGKEAPRVMELRRADYESRGGFDNYICPFCASVRCFQSERQIETHFCPDGTKVFFFNGFAIKGAAEYNSSQRKEIEDKKKP